MRAIDNTWLEHGNTGGSTHFFHQEGYTTDWIDQRCQVIEQVRDQFTDRKDRYQTWWSVCANAYRIS